MVTPILKKSGLDPTQLNNLRPVINLHFISKLVKRAVSQSYILMNMNCKHVTLLVLLDLSEAFDTLGDDMAIYTRENKPRLT